MDKLTRQAENEKFHEWYLKSGYHYKPETDEEGGWVVTVRYWAWKAWEERASQPIVKVGPPDCCVDMKPDPLGQSHGTLLRSFVNQKALKPYINNELAMELKTPSTERG